MGDHDEKSHYIKAYDLKYFIDDRAETCRELQRTGLMGIVYQQPWNRNGHDLPMVDSWQTIRRLCLE
jgi:hypothetical protein